MVRIMIVCTGNICRSPMAERLLLDSLPDHLKDNVEVKSAGTFALHGHQAAREAVRAMKELQIDLNDHRARQLTREMVRESDLIVAMENDHLAIIKQLHGWGKPNARLLGEFGPTGAPEEIEDPYGGPIEGYRTCVRKLQPCIRGLIAWIEERAPQSEA